MTRTDAETLRCPDCGRQLHSIVREDTYVCFNGPQYFEEIDGELVEVDLG